MELKLENLTEEQKIGMLLCARSFKDEDDLPFVLELIRNHALGSVQVPIGRPEIMQPIREAADYPILIVTDMEMGFPTSELSPVPLMTLAACDRPEYYRSFARAVVRDAKAAGFNGTWGPVIDVKGPRFRRISDDPETVAKGAEYIAQIYANEHFLSCGKHYPGGEHQGDTHMVANAVATTSLEELLTKKLYPYKYLMERGLLPSVMVGHGIQAAVDPEYPASLSAKVIGLIRDMGYDGVIFTDSLAMMAILQKYGEENVLGMAVAAGNDIVLPNYRSTNRKSYELLLQNYRDGAFSRERLDEAVRRVLQMHHMLGQAPTHPEPFTEQDRENYERIALDCITAVTDPGLTAAIPEEDRDLLFAVMLPQESGEVSPQAETITRDWYHPERIAARIREDFPEAEIQFFPEYPTAKENEKILLAATGHKKVVYVTFCTTRPYLGTDCMTRRAEAQINALICSEKVAAVVHFGNPRAVQPLLHMPRLLFGYMMPESQEYAIDVLAGKYPARGKLSFKVDLP